MKGITGYTGLLSIELCGVATQLDHVQKVGITDREADSKSAPGKHCHPSRLGGRASEMQNCNYPGKQS